MKHGESLITPARATAGHAFQLELTGAKPSETIRFTIDSSAGNFTGGPHTASSDGSVTATYQTAFGGATGIHKVLATGNMGTTIKASFRVVAPLPP